MKIYGISGLGADQRIFNFLSLELEIINIEWIKPLKNESIVSYSKRLSCVIDTKSSFCLIGVSFGGLVATEISLILKPRTTILISSVNTKEELRKIYLWFGRTNLIKIMPTSLFDPPRWIANYLFGAKNKKLLNDILNDADLKFVKWAVNELINWKNTTYLNNFLKINGTKDKLIPPIDNTGKIKLINNGEHFMIVDKAKEVSKLINEEIRRVKKIEASQF